MSKKLKKLLIVGVAIANIMPIAVHAESDQSALVSDLPDTYTHATVSERKEVLTGEEYEKALEFLADSSHYLYVNRATPYYKNFVDFPDTGFDTKWRSPLNGRVYRGPYGDPLTRSVNWFTTNPNGSINSSVGSYWACIPPNTDLELNYNELQGYQKKDDWQIVAYMGPGQSVENFINNGRGSIYVDASLVGEYGVTSGHQDRNVLNIEVKLDHYIRREITPEQFYDGLLPTTSSWKVDPQWKELPGWDEDSGDNRFRTVDQFWGSATGDDAEYNLTSDQERKEYLKRANEDPKVKDILNNVVIDLYFDIEQIVNIKQQIGFDFELDNGKVNAIDIDGDGFLDKDENSQILLLNPYDKLSLPEWAYELNFNDAWWKKPGSDDKLIDGNGKVFIGVNEDGSYIYEE